ncbi:MAG: magnesium-translocating P-type ATPase [Candidatus Limnocylindrales bacterium]
MPSRPVVARKPDPATRSNDGEQQAFWHLGPTAAFALVASRADGLSAAEAGERRQRIGPNQIGRERRSDALTLLVRQFTSPIILILVFATVVSGLLGDATDALIILAIIVLSGLLGFWQERGAARAVESLLAVVQVKAEVRRGGTTVDVPVVDIVPGDVVRLDAGDIVPGDCLVIDSTSLLADEAPLTGETYPVEKSADVLPADTPLARRTNAVFMGTHIVSGAATVLVMRTGAATEFGHVSASLAEKPVTTGFERGLNAFGYLLLRAMVVLVVVIFVVNLVLQRPFIDSALFSLALAVGLTPQLLPAIVSIGLAQGARSMARQRVIVKRLDAIEDFGSMAILCTDKTGTMTMGTVQLADALGLAGEASDEVRRMAVLNAGLQTGLTNPIDAALVAAGRVDTMGVQRLGELPYDFQRRRLSVLVDDGGPHQLITKGALESVTAVCTTARAADGKVVPFAGQRANVVGRYKALSAEGYRVLGVAVRDLGKAINVKPADEAALTFLGFLTFLDPPKPDIEKTLKDLVAAGVSVRMITGDNQLVAAQVGRIVGLESTKVMTGQALEKLSAAELAAAVGDVGIFAEVAPEQKERIIRALRANGAVVGYMGDGINDAPALHAADVGISVETAVDVAKESAAIVLLDKDLRVLLDGVRQGRRTFANTMKYVYTTTSANFGNMVSMAVAAVALPFLPLLAVQILLINFLTDFPSTTIATDDVDLEQLQRPETWDIGFVRTFMIVFGIISSAFDFATFAVLRIGFGADAVAFRSGWFIESVATELAVLFVLRTRRPFFRSRPSLLLLGASVALGVVTLAIPYTPLADLIGLDGPPLAMLAALAVITALYVVATEVGKQLFYRSRLRRRGVAG